MSIQSLDPRITRLALPTEDQAAFTSEQAGQAVTFEVFWKPKATKPYEHAGIVHASDLDMALLYAKEQFSRRGGVCLGIKVVATEDIIVSPYLDDNQNIFLQLDSFLPLPPAHYELFTSSKRGKQHQSIGTFDLSENFRQSEILNAGEPKQALNIWFVPLHSSLSIEQEETEFWSTLPDKGYRDALAYKSADKINAFKAANQKASSLE